MDRPHKFERTSTNIRGKKDKNDEAMFEQAERKLLTYSSLANPIRLKAFFLISRQPGIPFREVAKRIALDSSSKDSLVAYHLGVLKADGLVNFKLERQAKHTDSYSRYALTSMGEQVLQELTSKVDPSLVKS
jgi:DNA-binding transcriptional ArsR family regulator